MGINARLPFLLFVPLAAVALLGCHGDDPVGPVREPAIDLSPLVELLNDPLVLLLPSTVDDAAFSTPLQSELSSLRRSAEAGQVPAVRRSLASARAATKRYDDRTDIDPANRVILAAIELVLDRAQVLLEALVARGIPLSRTAIGK